MKIPERMRMLRIAEPGRAVWAESPVPTPGQGEVLLRVRDLSVCGPQGKPLEGISFEVRAGEVLGIGGLMGSGRSELLMHIFGAIILRRPNLYGNEAGGDLPNL